MPKPLGRWWVLLQRESWLEPRRVGTHRTLEAAMHRSALHLQADYSAQATVIEV